MLSVRQLAEKVIPGVKDISLNDLASSLGVPSPIFVRYLLEGKLFCELTLKSLKCLTTESSGGQTIVV
jgi:hypothetical protein